MGMIPGIKPSQAQDVKIDEKLMARTEAIIKSMTKLEREKPEINANRKKRIAAGSGTTVEDVNRLLRQFEQIRKMMKQLSGMNPKKMGKLGKMKIPF